MKNKKIKFNIPLPLGGIEDIVFHELEKIQCPIKKIFCPIRGHYFRCYEEKTYKDCSIYQNIIKHSNRLL